MHNGLREPREALRLALVMNGGVSLAVWMGGVTQEIFLLTQASRSLDDNVGPRKALVYRGLLNLMHSSAMVDVISGTSAGGVNGAALAVSLLYDGDFSQLREVWRDTGSLQTLLRPALGNSPVSLLQGDDYFLPEIRAALDRLVERDTARSASEQPLDLRLTTTLLTGYQGRHQDDLGTPLHDVDYRAQFLFRHVDDTQSCTKQSNWIDALARAARSTASFPFAFEPSRIDADTSAFFLRTPYGDELKPGARYVIDGGVLNNKPFKGALEAIFNMPRLGPTRRVLAYVNPDPGDGPEGATNRPMPSLSTVLGEALFAIPQSQSVHDQLHEIKLHNDKVLRQRDSLLHVVSALDGAQLLDQARVLYQVYRERRLVNTYGLFIAPNLSQAVGGLGRHTLNHLKAIFCDSKQVHPWLPSAWIDDEARAVGTGADWPWGLFPVEFATSVLLNMLKLSETLGCVFAPEVGEARLKRLSQLQQLGQAWPDVNDLANRVKARRQEESGAWKAYRTALSQVWKTDKGRVDKRGATMLGQLGFLSTPDRNQWCKQRVSEVAGQLQKLAPLAKWVAEHAIQSPLTGQHARRQAEGLKRLADLFNGQSAAHITHRLLQLEVVCYAFDDHESMDQDTLIELVQISGNLRSPLTEQANHTPASGGHPKLRGLELAHFGAFYKASWRVNDWIHGRLDGADRLVHTLLNPERLRMLYPGQAQAVARCIRVLALGASSDPTLKQDDDFVASYLCGPGFELQPDEQAELDKAWIETHSTERIAAELAFLDDPAQPAPDTLPHSAAAIVRRMHLQALREELPYLINAIAQDQDQGAEPAAHAAEIGRIVSHQGAVSAQDAIKAIGQGLINDESLMEQAGTDLFTRTVAHVTASLQNTLSSGSAKLGPISWFFTLLKVPVQGFNLVVQGLTRQSRTAAALHGGMLAAGLVLVLISGFLQDAAAVAAQPTEAPTLPASLVDVGWLMMIWGTLFTVMRSPRVSLVIACSALVGLMMGTLTGRLHLLPDWCLAWGAGGFLVLVGLLIAILLYLPQIPWLQWALGLAAIPVFASWSTHQPIWQRQWQMKPVEWYALGLVAVLLLAIWQASPYGIKAESTLRRLLKK